MQKMTKTELIQLVTKICNAEFETEKELESLLMKFKFNVADPEAANLIYYHKPELTPEEIVEKALAYKPIILPPPEDSIPGSKD